MKGFKTFLMRGNVIDLAVAGGDRGGVRGRCKRAG